MNEVLSVTQAERDKAKKAGNSLPDGSYPINNAAQLHAAAVLAASHHGDWKAAQALIRRRAKELGVDVTTLPGFGGESKSAQRDPAWEQRRKRWAGSLVGQHARRSMALARGSVEMRAKPDGTGGTNFEFNGYGSTFNDPFDMWDKWGDPYTEDVRPGSFRETLGRPDLYVPFLIGHNAAGIQMARTRSGTMRLAEDTRGLHTEAMLSGRRSDVRDLADAVERGDMDEMSIGFVTLAQEWSEDWEQRHLTNVDLHRGDVSVVALAANPGTRGATMTALPVESLSNAAAVQREEQRGNPVDQDLGDASDYDPWDHAAPGALRCGNDACPVDGGAINHPDSKFCAQCGTPLYGGDALVKLNADGVPGMEEEQGAAASLALKRRQLELLALVK